MSSFSATDVSLGAVRGVWAAPSWSNCDTRCGYSTCQQTVHVMIGTMQCLVCIPEALTRPWHVIWQKSDEPLCGGCSETDEKTIVCPWDLGSSTTNTVSYIICTRRWGTCRENKGEPADRVATLSGPLVPSIIQDRLEPIFFLCTAPHVERRKSSVENQTSLHYWRACEGRKGKQTTAVPRRAATQRSALAISPHFAAIIPLLRYLIR